MNNFNNFDLEDFPAAPGQSQPVTPWLAVTPEYFRVLGLTLLEGRLLDERDAQRQNLETVVVDRAWARRFFPNQSALGKRFREGGCTTCPWTQVVGVVSEVKYTGLDKPDEGTVYAPWSGSFVRFIVLRTNSDPASVLPAVRQTIRDLRFNGAVRQRRHDRRARRAIGADAALVVVAHWESRRRCADAGDRRHLWRHGVLRAAAHQGHRDSAGPRGPARRRAPARRRPGHDPGCRAA